MVTAFKVSKRIMVTIPDSVYNDLTEWAEQQGRPTANLAAYLVEVGIRDGKTKGEFKPAQANGGKTNEG